MKKKEALTMRSRKALTGISFTAIWVIGFLLFTLYPIIYSIQLSLHSVQFAPTGIQMTWEGMHYYDYAWNADTTFKLNLGNTVIFIVCAVPVALVFALLIAVALNRNFKGRTFFRSVFFLPVVIMSGQVVQNLLDKYSLSFSDSAPWLYDFISNLPEFISTPALFILNNFLLILWFSGVQILIMLAGLQKISPDIYQAADIDGASGWQKFWKITLPQMNTILLLSAVYTVVTIANYSKNEMNGKISANLFDTNRIYSYSAAMSWIYFFVIMLILLGVFLIFKWFGREKK